MLILRTYALYERNNRILALMLVFGVAVVCVCLVRLVFCPTIFLILLQGTILFSAKGAGLGGDLELYIGCNYAITARQYVFPALFR
jgi:hypothetical protein